MLQRMNYYFSRMSRPRRILAQAMAGLLAIVLVILFSGQRLAQLGGAVLLVGLLLLAQELWLPRHLGRLQLRKGLLVAISCQVATMPLLRDKLERWLKEQVAPHLGAQLAGALGTIAPSERWLTAAIEVGLVMATGGIYALLRDKSAMTKHPKSVDKEFPEKTYRERRKAFCTVLGRHIEGINIDTNWSDAYYTALEAEVEVKKTPGGASRVMDLLGAIRHNHSARLFVVLGDPGSGKSVAMRKLALDLLNEVTRTGKIPIYVNLKEWQPTRTWTELHPPTDADLRQFIETNLQQRLDTISAEFVKEFFDRMLKDGRLFFILDSFDEIPLVLDVDEGSWLIREISRSIDRLFAGAQGTRGVLASRLYRCPKIEADDVQVMEIRPFDEKRIAETLRRGGGVTDSMLKEIFVERTELVPIARNPFTAELLRSYIGFHHALPVNQVELYRSYVARRLDSSRELSGQTTLETDEVVNLATDIAWVIFRDQRRGLEIAVPTLEKELQSEPIAEAVRLMAYARLARIGRGNTGMFSFVHRRFNEYFVARRLIEDDNLVDLESIPTDSRFRDALVLYCEVAEAARTKRIAESCWKEIRQIGEKDVKIGSAQYARAVHCLRFLGTAFRTQPELISPFRAELGNLVLELANPGRDLLLSKHALEAANLLDDEILEEVVRKALSRESMMLRETALRSCRYLPRLRPDIDRGLRAFLYSMPFFMFVRRRHDLKFSFGLSEGFRDLQGVVVVKTLDSIMFAVGLIILTLHTPLLTLWATIFCLVFLISTSINILLFHQLFSFVKIRPKKRHTDNLLKKIIFINRITPRDFFAIGFLAAFVLAWFDPIISRTGPVSAITGFEWVDNRWYLAGVSALVVPLILPTYLFVFFLKMPRTKDFINFIIIVLTSILVISTVLALTWATIIGLTWFVAHLPANIANILKWIALVILILGGSGLLLNLVYSAWFRPALHSWRDVRAMSRIQITQTITRQWIEETYSSFHSRKGRERFVQLLAEAQVIPSGDWKNGIPNTDDDWASEKLALLEEKWLGLNY
jgi:hypothetical protein